MRGLLIVAVAAGLSACATTASDADPVAAFLDRAIIVGQQYASTPARQAVADGVVLSTYTAALALLVHGLRDQTRQGGWR